MCDRKAAESPAARLACQATVLAVGLLGRGRRLGVSLRGGSGGASYSGGPGGGVRVTCLAALPAGSGRRLGALLALLLGAFLSALAGGSRGLISLAAPLLAGGGHGRRAGLAAPLVLVAGSDCSSWAVAAGLFLRRRGGSPD